MKLVPYGAGLKSELGEKTLSAVKSGTMGDLSLCSVLSWVSFNNLWPM